MKYSYNWLKEISGTKLSAEKSAELLTMHSMELEGMERMGKEFDGVVVGEILEVKKHPNADKLRIARVDVGNAALNFTTPSQPSPEYRGRGGRNELLIVCGAPNIEAGQKVPVALIGTKMPNGLEIKAAEIRGEKSFGMLCAPDELGLGEDHSGIMILEKSAKVGESFAEYLGMDDTIFEIKVLPDRAHDALSHVGVAREISALEGKKLDYDFDGLELAKKKTKKLQVEIRDKDLCSRYIGAVMENIEIKESPGWMKARLKASGMNAINNVVDATNYVMLELGQPLHAFDADKLKDRKIVVRKAKKDEEINLLDKGLKKLSEKDLVITEGGRAVALAGIKGARAAEIDRNTKNVVLEAASFNAINVRRTRTRLNIKTESSDRYEKDIDPNLCEKAIVRLIEILEHTAGAKLEGIEDVYPVRVKPWKIKLDLEYTNNLLGEKVPAKEVGKTLNLLGVDTKYQVRNAGYLDCVIPTFRLDIRTQEDLIEEVGRVRGYEKIKPQALLESVEPAHINERVSLERKVKDVLAGLGADEVYNYSFYSKKDADICGLTDVKHYELANPMSPEQELVRASLLPNILKNVRENLKHLESLSLFEIGRAYYPNNGKPEEKRMLVVAQVLEKDKDAETFYETKGLLENLLESLGIKETNVNVLKEIPKIAHPGRAGEIEARGHKIGMIGEVNPKILSQYKIGKRVALIEIDLEKLLILLPKTKKYHPISKFPTVMRDISMVVPDGVTYFQIEQLVKKSGGQLVNSVSLFDYFKAKKSLAIRIFFSADRTLESAEVDAAMEKIIASLEIDLKVEVRK